MSIDIILMPSRITMHGNGGGVKMHSTSITLMWDGFVMAAPKKNPLGPTGETLRQNIKFWRESQNLSFADLARRLEEVGRPIATLGLSRIEKGERRVDADDLLALAEVLGASPASLLMPRPAGLEPLHEVELTGPGKVPAQEAWWWLTGFHNHGHRPDIFWRGRSQPPWELADPATRGYTLDEVARWEKFRHEAHPEAMTERMNSLKEMFVRGDD